MSSCLELNFAYNKSYQSSILIAPYKALYKRQYLSPVGQFELDETKLLGPNFIKPSLDKVKLIQEQLRSSGNSE